MFRNVASLLLLALLVTACGQRGGTPETEATPEVTEEVGTCFGFDVDNPDNITCVESGGTQAVVQAEPDTTTNLSRETLAINLVGTLIIQQSDEATSVTALEGNNTITFNGETINLSTGSRIEFPIVDGVVQSPAAVEETDITTIDVSNLPRNLNAEETSEVTIEPITDTSQIDDNTPQEAVVDLADGCDSSWTNVYVVKPGDILQLIARDYGTTVEDMATNNCLLNPSRLAIDQVLRVPKAIPLTPTPSVFFFFASESTLYDGNCTLLRWDAVNIESVFLDGEEVENTGLETVCPEETTTYVLRIEYPDGSVDERETTVEIIPRPR